jgi:diguanylate cyclase (GGDEF)-like protein
MIPRMVASPAAAGAVPAPPLGHRALRLARKAWALLHLEPERSLALAERALQRAAACGDDSAAASARLTRGFHRLYFGTPDEALPDLDAARAACAALQDRAGELLATAGIARANWRSGRVQQALQMLLPLRDEGVVLLHHEQRGVLLNAFAGCYSALGRSEEAFAYMYEALREAGPERGNGFDTVLHCNLSHELMQLGDYDEALAQVERGLASRAGLRNTRLLSVLLVNRVVSLTELGRADEALADVRQLVAMPEAERGRTALHFETMAIAALRAGAHALGAALVARAEGCSYPMLADEQVELAVARALLARAEGAPREALARLLAAGALVGDGGGDSADGASLRARCLHAQLASELHEALGDAPAALAAVRRWQQLNTQRARMASRARYQAAMLQTELLKLRHQLEENDARQRASERARAELAAANAQLSHKIAEVEALQAALRQQATQDALTGLANRRHLNDTLPSLLALALRERVPLAVVVIDLDHFKAVNDEHGHAAGDRLLAAFGQLLHDRLRASDQAFRYGGEEFCLLMPYTAAAAARHKVEELLEEWRARRFELERATLAGLSFSAGVADSLHAPLSPDGLLHAADALLLEAKRRGRARVLAHAERAGALP